MEKEEKNFRKMEECASSYGKIMQVFKLVVLLAFLGAFGLTSFANPGVSPNETVLTQEQVTVTGVVKDKSGVPIPGVNVFNKADQLNGVITDFDGNYTITVPSDATLVFSFIGFNTQEIPVGGKTKIDVTMTEETQKIEEVVVTALGIKRETKKLGYAMTEVKGSTVAEVNTVSTVDALKGQAAGVSIGQSDGGLFGSNKIQIRGVSVMGSSNNNPIFVIDGVILQDEVSDESADWSGTANDFGNILKNLNPEDYESVSILKGAAATALYGSRGINGAIIIKTKDGKGTKGLGVNVSQVLGFVNVNSVADIQQEYGTGTYAGNIEYGNENRFITDQFYMEGDMPTKRNHPSGYGFGPKYDGREIIDFDGSMDTYKPYPHNAVDAFNRGFVSTTSLSFRGGNDKGSFYLSDNYTHRKGIYPNNSFDKNSIQFNGSYHINDWLTADASVSYTSSKPQNPRNDLSGYFPTGTWNTWYNTNKWNKPEVYRAPHGGVPNPDYGDKYGYVPGNNVWFQYQLNSFRRVEQVTRPVVKLTFQLADWISLALEGNVNYYTLVAEDKEHGEDYGGQGGFYKLQNNFDLSKDGKVTVNINKEFSEKFSMNVVLGGEVWSQKKTKAYSQTDGGLIVPNQFFVANSKRVPLTESTIYGTKQINSLYFLFNFSLFKNQLFIDLTGRNDWSSALVYTNGTGNFSYFYPSVTASWLFTETFNAPSWFSFGKLRFSWAQVGNDTSPYSLNKGYELDRIQLNDNAFAYTNTMNSVQVDPNILPERKNSIEVGADLRFFTNRLGFDFSYYNETIKNQIGNVPLPGESGIENLFSNIGTLTNKGWELMARGVPVKSKAFTWTTIFRFWQNQTQVTDLHDAFGAYMLLNGDIAYGNFRIGSVAYDGGDYGVLMSDSKPKEDENGNKVLIWRQDMLGAYYDRSYQAETIGSIMPKFEFSWSNDFEIKNFTVNIMMDARFGGDIGSYSNKYGTAYGWMETSLKYRDEAHGGLSWTSQYPESQGITFHDGVIPDGVFADGTSVVTPTGQQVDVSGMSYQEAYNNGYVEPTHASFWTVYTSGWSTGTINDNWFNEIKYVAFRNVSVGYRFGEDMAKKIKARSIYVGFNARNLGYIYNSLPNHLNPESFRGTSSSSGYLERSFTPYSTTYTFTLTFDF